MKIFHLIPDIDSEAAGPSASVTSLVSGLREVGLDCNLVLGGRKPNFKLVNPSWSLFFPGYAGYFSDFSFKWLMFIVDMMRNNETVILHQHSLWKLSNILPGLLFKFNSSKKNFLIASPRGTLSPTAFRSGSRFKNLIWYCLQRPALMSVSVFHATSIGEASDIRSKFVDTPIVVFPNPVQNYFLSSARRQKKESELRKLLFIGRLHPIKGLENLLEAWGRVGPKYRNWVLEIRGPASNDYATTLEDLVVKLRLTNINISGGVFGDEKWELIRDADVTILPSFSENFGMSVAESLAVGTPAIVSSRAPWSSAAKSGCCWICDPDAGSIQKILESVFKLGPHEWRRAGDCGRRFIEEKYSVPAVSSIVHRIYELTTQGRLDGFLDKNKMLCDEVTD